MYCADEKISENRGKVSDVKMTYVKPFKGVLYNRQKLGQEADSVYAPPYDVISDEAREELYSKSEFNIIRLILGKESMGDNPVDNKYKRAGALLGKWISENILIRDEEEAFYVYAQEYGIENDVFRRIGFLGLMKIEEPGEARVLPHEKTHSTPKIDRMDLIKEVKANLSPIFSLFPDDEGYISGLLERSISGKPPLIDVDHNGEKHMLWRIGDSNVISDISDFVGGRNVFIADGHHRYEVAKNFRDIARKKPGYKGEADHVMMFFSGIGKLNDLMVMGTHRIIKNVSFSGAEEIEEILKPHFYSKNHSNLKELMDYMKENMCVHVFGFFGMNRYISFRLKEESFVEELVGCGRSRLWKSLDVSILHHAIFEKLLGIKPEEGDILYSRSPEESVEMAGASGMVFFLNPTRVDQLRELAEAREMMPQKSTYFYPKLLSGLVINKFGE